MPSQPSWESGLASESCARWAEGIWKRIIRLQRNRGCKKQQSPGGRPAEFGHEHTRQQQHGTADEERWLRSADSPAKPVKRKGPLTCLQLLVVRDSVGDPERRAGQHVGARTHTHITSLGLEGYVVLALLGSIRVLRLGLRCPVRMQRIARRLWLRVRLLMLLMLLLLLWLLWLLLLGLLLEVELHHCRIHLELWRPRHDGLLPARRARAHLPRLLPVGWHACGLKQALGAASVYCFVFESEGSRVTSRTNVSTCCSAI